MRNTSYADYSNKKARNMGLATFKSWSDMSEEEKKAYQQAEKKSSAELWQEARQDYERKKRGF